MTAYVNIGVARRDDVLLVPNAALRFKPADGDGKAEEQPAERPAANGRRQEGKGRGGKGSANSGTVYVVEGNTLKPVGVQLGITDNRNTEVIGGDLKAGDTVVVSDAPTAAAKPSSVGMRLF